MGRRGHGEGTVYQHRRAILGTAADGLVKPTVRHTTYQSYAQMARLHILPSLGRIEVSKLTPQQVQAWLNRKLASGLSPRIVSYARRILRQALEQASRWSLVARNVAKLVDPLSVPQHEMRFLSPAQARQLIAGMLQVVHQLQWIEGQFRLLEPKIQQSPRTITLPSFVVAGLRTHHIHQLEDRLLTREAWQSGDWNLVFCTRLGTPCAARNVVRDFKKLLQRAGLPDMRFHDLRHSAATLLLAKGVPHRVVMEILGHSPLSLTMRYSHVIAELQQEAAQKLHDLLTTGCTNPKSRRC